MIPLPPPNAAYDQNNEAQTRKVIDDRFRQVRQNGDLEIAPLERFFMTDGVTGERGVLSIESGVVTWTVL